MAGCSTSPVSLLSALCAPVWGSQCLGILSLGVGGWLLSVHKGICRSPKGNFGMGAPSPGAAEVVAVVQAPGHCDLGGGGPDLMPLGGCGGLESTCSPFPRETLLSSWLIPHVVVLG